MSIPFFSVVIPTKNRSALATLAIQSLIRQTFKDFEVVIADNDDSDDTRLAVASFNDQRIKYARARSLSMADNWEFALEQARGEYVCILEDKQVFKGRALQRLHDEIEVHRPESIKWRCDAFDDEWGIPRIRRDPGIGTARWQTSDELLAAFVGSRDLNYKSILPLPQRGCLSRSLIDRIRASPAKRLCPPITPDIKLALAQLACTDRVLDIDDALVAYSSHRHSNGRSFTLKGELFKRFIKDLGGDQGIFHSHVPVKAVTVPGTIINDYLVAQSLLQGRLLMHQVQWPNYFVQCFRAMRNSEVLGVEMHEELVEWQRALAAQPLDIQGDVRQMLANQGIQEGLGTSAGIMERLGGLMKSPHIEKRLKSWYRGNLLRDPEWRFRSAMAYLEWEDTTPGISRRSWQL